MDKIAVFLSNYLNSSETFIYRRLVNFRAFKPIVLSYGTENLDVFPFEPVYSFHSDRPLVEDFKRFMLVNFGFSPFFESVLKSNGVKLVQAHFTTRAKEILPVTKRLKIPQVNFFHGSDLDACKDVRKLVKDTAASATVSETMRRDLIRRGCDENKIFVNYAGIELGNFSFRKRSPKKGKMRVLMCGRLFWKKGFDDGIKAFSMALSKHPNLEMRILGDGEMRGRLKKMIGKMGLGGKIKMAGKLPPDSIPLEMDEADIMLVPSVEEGLPNVIKEALASGLPVISTNVGGIPELIEDGVNGFLVDPENASQMAEKLICLIEGPELWGRFADEGRAAVEEKFDVKKQMSRLEKKYGEIING